MAVTKRQKNNNIENSQQTDSIYAAIDYGIDISMLDDNIRRSVFERIQRHQIAFNTMERLQALKKKRS